MTAEMFYQKQMGPRRTPPPKPTPFVEITSAVPDLSLISNCQPNERQNIEMARVSNECHLREYNSASASKDTKLVNSTIENKLPDCTDRMNYSEGRQSPLSQHVRRNSTSSRLSPVMPCDNERNDDDDDSNRLEVKGSYQSWRAKHADLFNKPESRGNEVVTQPSFSHKKSFDNFDRSHRKTGYSPPQQTAVVDKYNEYFKTRLDSQVDNEDNRFSYNKHENEKLSSQRDCESYNMWRTNHPSKDDCKNYSDQYVRNEKKDNFRDEQIVANRSPSNEMCNQYRVTESVESMRNYGHTKNDYPKHYGTRNKVDVMCDKDRSNTNEQLRYRPTKEIADSFRRQFDDYHLNRNDRIALQSEPDDIRQQRMHLEEIGYSTHHRGHVDDLEYRRQNRSYGEECNFRRDAKYSPQRRKNLSPCNQVVSYKNMGENGFHCCDDDELVKQDSRMRNPNHSPIKTKTKLCSHPKYSEHVQRAHPKRHSLSKYKRNRQSSCKCCNGDNSDSDSSVDRVLTPCCEEKRVSKNKNVSVDDLYHIVKLQNEQISLLQKQVDRLLEKNKKSPVKSKSTPLKRKPCKRSPNSKQTCSCQDGNESSDSKPSDKFSTQGFTLSVVRENSQIECQSLEKHSGVSIGVMTSFVEIMQKAQIGQKNATCQNNGFRKECPNAGSSEGEQEITELPQKREDYQTKKGKLHHKQSLENYTNSASKRNICRGIPTVVEESFTLNEGDLPVVPEHQPSPECSVHIDLQDYGSSSSPSASSEDESGPGGEGNAWGTNTDGEDPKVGWTLYDNVVGQVNNILQRGAIAKKKEPTAPSPEDVRKATMERLRMLGVNLGDIENSTSKKVTFDQEFYPQMDLANQMQHLNVESSDNETSLHINALAKKYLNQDQLPKAAINMANRKDVAMYNFGNGNGNLSFATLRYLERYNILPGTNKGKQQVEGACAAQVVRDIPKPSLPQHLRHQPPQRNFPSTKILDITALKQQPKLL